MHDRPVMREKIIYQLKHFYPNITPIIFDAINTRYLNNHYVGCTLSHRAVIADAKANNYKNILVFEEDAVLHKDFSNILNRCTDELSFNQWDIFYLGACVWGKNFDKQTGCQYLEKVYGSTCTQGIAYNHSIYDYMLNNLPANIDDMILWCKHHLCIDQWLMYHIQSPRIENFTAFISSPRICSQPFLIGYNKQDNPDDFWDYRNIQIYDKP